MWGVESACFETWILGSLTSGVVGIDGDGAVVTFNTGAQRILGCPKGEARAALGKDCREVLEAQPEVARLLIETRDRRTTLSRAELALDGSDGRPPGTIGFTLFPVHDADDEPCGAAMIFRDLAPIERLDEQERLRERLTALGQMAAGLAHEIRNPLAGMEVLAGLLKRRLASRPEEQALVTELGAELRSLADTVRASLDFVRPIALERGPVDLVELLEDSLAVARTRLAWGGRVERDYDDAPPRFHGDAQQLRTVFTNLIVNALESMDGNDGARESRLRLVLQTRGSGEVDGSPPPGGDGRGAGAREVVVGVSDSGPGIPAELHEKIFYPFFTTKQRGSGVGLATVQKIVATHGGGVELDSQPGEGSTFRLRFPLESGDGA